MKLHIPQEVWDKVMFWVNRKDMEVSGFGKVTYDESTKQFTVVDAYLLEQEGGAAHTDIDDASLARLMYEARNVEGELSWWWHSHVKMNVFWSTTDRETIQDLGKHGWIVASVFNQREEVHSAVCYQTTVNMVSEFGSECKISTNFIDDIKTFITNPRPDDPRHVGWAAEYDKHVKEEVRRIPHHPFPGGAQTTQAGTQRTTQTESSSLIYIGDHALTQKEWDEFTKSSCTTVAQWKASRQPTKPTSVIDINICTDCGNTWRYCDCDATAISPTISSLFDDAGWDPGLLGCGASEEAEYLVVDPSYYLDMINKNAKALTTEEQGIIDHWMDELAVGIAAGELYEQTRQ